MKLLLFFLLLLTPFFPLQAEVSVPAEVHLKRAEAYTLEGSPFAAVEEYRQALQKGLQGVDVQQQLAILLYNLGFVDDAIEVMEQALQQAAEVDHLHHELGVLCFVKDRWAEAQEQFLATLRINPCSADTYYYLGHLSLRQKNVVAARLFARAARQLGHRAVDLERLLDLEQQFAEENIWLLDEEKIYLRQILVADRRTAEGILARLAAGGLFEDVAGNESLGRNGRMGGYAGGFLLQDLQPQVASALIDLPIMGAPVVVETAAGFNVIQRLAPVNWSYVEQLLQKKALVKTGVRDVAPTPTAVELTPPKAEHAEFDYLVQAGAFRERRHAEERLKKLQQLGFSGYLYEELHAGTPWYMASAGAYAGIEEARSVVKRLDDLGLDAFVSKRKRQTVNQ